MGLHNRQVRAASRVFTWGRERPTMFQNGWGGVMMAMPRRRSAPWVMRRARRRLNRKANSSR